MATFSPSAAVQLAINAAREAGLLDGDDFVEAGSPLPWSKEYLVTIDFDGGAGGNSANVTVVLFLSE